MEIVRRHQAITSKIERKILNFIAKRIYRYFKADHLSLLAIIGAIIAAFGYFLAKNNLNLLHLANLGIFIHWFGDSLDGTVAKLRNESRPKYGHYLDHILDAICATIVIFGINFSGLSLESEWVWVLAIFLLIMIHSFLKASVTGIFDLSFERFGPTEVRLGFVFMNLILLYSGNPLIIGKPISFTLLDIFGLLASATLLIVLIQAVSKSLCGRRKIKEN